MSNTNKEQTTKLDLSPVARARRPARERRQTAAVARAPPDIAPTRRTSRFLYRHSATTSNNVVHLLAVPRAASIVSAKITVTSSGGPPGILHYHPRTKNNLFQAQGKTNTAGPHQIHTFCVNVRLLRRRLQK